MSRQILAIKFLEPKFSGAATFALLAAESVAGRLCPNIVLDLHLYIVETLTVFKVSCFTWHLPESVAI